MEDLNLDDDYVRLRYHSYVSSKATADACLKKIFALLDSSASPDPIRPQKPSWPPADQTFFER